MAISATSAANKTCRDSASQDSVVRADLVLHIAGRLDTKATRLRMATAGARTMHLLTAMATASLLTATATTSSLPTATVQLITTGEDQLVA